ncbi:812_t:CDS:10 [Ambispora leptoticha]|uniref:Cap-specific mRNA (nucleoside-2'-O-)-methyltransferase 1 n=1 Tax=Ambispora leptoticha TaxID=144679 RepID=A0A9N8V9U1_9GLOM|nr:812_t:CDS:10 [Ambispora leptoticha]
MSEQLKKNFYQHPQEQQETIIPYTDTNPEYRETPLISPIPRPTIESCPPLTQSQLQTIERGAGSTYMINTNTRQQQQQHYLPNRMNFQPVSSSIHSRQRQREKIPLPLKPESRQQISQMQSSLFSLASAADIERQNNSDFLYCRIPFDATRELEGLKMVIGKPSPPDYDVFCSAKIVDGLFERKHRLSTIPHEKLTAARGKSNPYEKTSNSIFINRAAVKLACLDATNRLTGKKFPNKRPYRFADICGGPGGFSEYILWRKHVNGEDVYGWGITLIGDKDFVPEKFHPDSGVDDCYEIIYGADGTGDICKEENIREFGRIILDKTMGAGVDLVVADGGIDFRGFEQEQETRMRQLILCQVTTMFLALQQNGEFVLKVFDVFTQFTAGIIWILYRHFKCIRIQKPEPSRPANSERYIICRGLHQSRPTITNYLFDINRKLNDLSRRRSRGEHEEQDIIQIVEFEEMKKDESFMQYLKNSNEKIALEQSKALDELLRYVHNPELKPKNQEEIRRERFAQWLLPIEEHHRRSGGNSGRQETNYSRHNY